jgi:hypothetical protein
MLLLRGAANNHTGNPGTPGGDGIDLGPIANIQGLVLVDSEPPERRLQPTWMGLKLLHLWVLGAHNYLEEVC